MAYITSDQLRDISVKTVEGFLNDSVPLSVGLAKQASELQLNQEQINRAIEATNSIAHLKIIGMAEDRTTEFPLCKYAEVIEHIALPGGMPKFAGVEKQTSMEKVAGDMTLSTDDLTLTPGQANAAFVKFAAVNQRELEELQGHGEVLAASLEKAAKAFKKDEECLEKLAEVAGADYALCSALVFGEVKAAHGKGIYKEAELKEAKALVGLLKEAQTVQKSIVEHAALAAQVLEYRIDTLEKTAGYGQAALHKAVSVGKGLPGAVLSTVGHAAGSVVGKVGQGLANGGMKLGKGVAESVAGKLTGTKTPLSSTSKAINTGATAAMYGIGGHAVFRAGAPTRNASGGATGVWDALSGSTQL